MRVGWTSSAVASCKAWALDFAVAGAGRAGGDRLAQGAAEADRWRAIRRCAGRPRLVWSRTDRPARMIVEWDTRSVLASCVGWSRRSPTSASTTPRDRPAWPPADQSIFYRVRFEDARDGSLSKPWFNHLRSAPSEARNIRFVWSGDTCGQGFGINPDIGGMRICEAMRRRQPDFFLHSGDTIYADGPIPERIETESGRIWRNRVTEAKSKVAETLDEFRGNYRYNLLDDNLRRFNAEVPQIWQWDDHETTNNWSSSKQLDERYQVKDIDVLAARARQAFSNTRRCASSARGATGDSTARSPTALARRVRPRHAQLPRRQQRQPAGAAQRRHRFLGREQLQWLKRELRGSRAQWKVIAADMPIGLCVPDGKDAQGRDRWEAIANGNDGAATRPRAGDRRPAALRPARRGAQHRLADRRRALLRSHHYSPERAAFKDFAPFWEFVAGPLNAGSFGPNALDGTFGPQVMFQKAPLVQNSSPFAGYQFFGEVEIDAQSRALTVTLRDLDGEPVFSQELQPDGA